MKRNVGYIVYKVLFAALITFFLIGQACAQSQEGAFDTSERKAVVERITDLLAENYVFPEVGKKSGDHIKAKLAAGDFDTITDPESFAKTLTSELQSVNNDKHIRVRVRRPERARQGQDDPNAARLRWLREMRESNYGFQKLENFEGNIGYLDLRGFLPADLGKNTVVGAMQFLANSDAIIIDLRKNGGGSPGMVQLICSYFFDEKVHLNSLYWRRGDRTEEFWTLDKVDGDRMPEVPLFVLTSKRTFSGAEEFAYNMQTRKRATLIGETTGGGANPGGGFDINERFTIFIPTGRAINPVTGTNWEGVGVIPEFAVDADKALDKALELARQAAEDYRQAEQEKSLSTLNEMRKALEQADAFFANKTIDKAEKMVFDALDQARQNGILSEGPINAMGYDYLGKEQKPMAIAIFKYNVSSYPESSNVYDSLGEAYMENGDKELAIKNYKKSLVLDPRNDNAKQMLAKMSMEK